MQKTKLRFELYLGLITFLFPFGWSISGFQPNIILACVCWLLTIFLIVHVFLGTNRLPIFMNAVIALFFVTLIVSFAWKPIIQEYNKEYFRIDDKKFTEALKNQSSARHIIKMGCAKNLEESCITAGHFLKLIRNAGWIVENNIVQRIEITKPESGILLFSRGQGKETNNPNSGLWILQSDSLKTVQKAFEDIGLLATQRADPYMPEGVIGIYFGYKANIPK
jgi:hypothetical protein